MVEGHLARDERNPIDDPAHPLDPQKRDAHAKRRAHQRERRALGQQLSQEPSASGTQGRSYRDLSPACGRSGQQQVGDVGARDEEHESHGCQKHEGR